MSECVIQSISHQGGPTGNSVGLPLNKLISQLVPTFFNKHKSLHNKIPKRYEILYYNTIREPREEQNTMTTPGIEHIPNNIELHITTLLHFISDAYGYTIWFSS